MANPYIPIPAQPRFVTNPQPYTGPDPIGSAIRNAILPPSGNPFDNPMLQPWKSPALDPYTSAWNGMIRPGLGRDVSQIGSLLHTLGNAGSFVLHGGGQRQDNQVLNLAARLHQNAGLPSQTAWDIAHQIVWNPYQGHEGVGATPMSDALLSHLHGG